MLDTPKQKKISLVVLISGNGSNLAAIINAIQKRYITDASIAAVISNRPNALGLDHARNHGIKAICLDHTTFENRESFDQTLLREIEGINPDLVILAGFMRILTPAFVQALKGKLLNVHPSLLPNYQGLNTHQRVIDAGDKQHGCSIHYVTEELDGGPVIAQATVNIEPGDTATNLTEKVRALEHKLFPLCIHWYTRNRLALMHNLVTLDGKALGPQGYRISSTDLEKQFHELEIHQSI